MKSLKKNASLTKIGRFVVLCLLFFGLSGAAHSTEIIDIDVVPNVLNLGSCGTVVTVYTGIDYIDVVDQDITLDVTSQDIMIDSCKADNRGYFVARFSVQEVKSAAEGDQKDEYLQFDIPGEYSLTIRGLTTDGEEFEGTAYITVIDVEPRATGRL